MLSKVQLPYVERTTSIRIISFYLFFTKINQLLTQNLKQSDTIGVTGSGLSRLGIEISQMWIGPKNILFIVTMALGENVTAKHFTATEHDNEWNG